MPEIVYVAIPQETVNDESVRILSWKVASGTVVTQDQALCEIETSKAVMDIEAPAAGTVVYSAQAGDEVPVGSTICQIVPAGMAVPSMADTAEEMGQADAVGQPSPVDAPVEIVEASPAASVTTAPAASAPKSAVLADVAVEAVIADADLPPARLTPLAAKLAAEFGFAKESFKRGALVRREDVLRRAGKLPPVAEKKAVVAAPAAVPAAAAKAEPEANPPVAGVAVAWSDLPRKKTFEARLLGQGKARTVQSQVTTSVRATRLRARLARLGLGDSGLGALTIFEAARLLKKYPEFNAVHDRGRIGLYGEVNVGWAVDGGAGSQGLMVPVVPKADEKTVQEIAEIMERQIDAYVESKLTTTDFLGGTFTISDLSGDGVSHFQPLISQGQAAILGVGGEVDAAGNETLYLTLSFDHQLAEGRKAAQFVRELAQRLEAHAALEPAPVQAAPAAGEPYCALCQRDKAALKAIRGILVKSEIPAGYVCSVCLAEMS